MIDTFLSKIKDCEEKVITGDILAEVPLCVLCNSPGSNLSIHERRSRHIYIIDTGEVIDHLTLLSRLKCAVCKRTFTHYPDFIAPYKRYIPLQVLEMTERYREPHTGYRKSISWNFRTICWKNKDRWFSHVTLWRWISGLARQQILKRILSLIRQRAPSSDVFRRIVPVCPEKFRSLERKKILQRSFRLVDAVKEAVSIFGKTFFPRFETALRI